MECRAPSGHKPSEFRELKSRSPAQTAAGWPRTMGAWTKGFARLTVAGRDEGGVGEGDSDDYRSPSMVCTRRTGIFISRP